MRTRKTRRLSTPILVLALLSFSVHLDGTPVTNEIFIPVLKTKSGTYTNVTITAKSGTDLCLMHKDGVGNVSYADLDPEVYALVDYVPPPPKESGGVMRAWMAVSGNAEEPVAEAPPMREVDPAIFMIAGVISLLFHFLVSYCFMRICNNAGCKPGALIWLPVLQVLPLFRAAGMSAWWLLGLLVPVLNLVVIAMWCIKITSQLGRSPFWAIPLILPFSNLPTLIYLAFSRGRSLETPVETPRGATTFMVPGILRS